jgi:hypothetical protein
MGHYALWQCSRQNPDGTMFINDVSKGGLWFFPARYSHSIEGLGPCIGRQSLILRAIVPHLVEDYTQFKAASDPIPVTFDEYLWGVGASKKRRGEVVHGKHTQSGNRRHALRSLCS